jgi:hypothetical protein
MLNNRKKKVTQSDSSVDSSLVQSIPLPATSEQVLSPIASPERAKKSISFSEDVAAPASEKPNTSLTRAQTAQFEFGKVYDDEEPEFEVFAANSASKLSEYQQFTSDSTAALSSTSTAGRVSDAGLDEDSDEPSDASSDYGEIRPGSEDGSRQSTPGLLSPRERTL